MRRLTSGSVSGRVFVVACLMLVGAAVAGPFVWAIGTSLKNRVDALATPPVLFGRPTLEHYHAILSLEQFRLPLLNSVLIATGSTILTVVVGVPAGLAFSLKRAGSAAAAFVSILGIRMAPPMVFALPVFVIFSRVGLGGSRLSIVLMHAAVNLPIVVWLLKIYFDRVPGEVFEASLLDGDGVWSALWRQIVPAAARSVAVVGLVAFMLSWNEFFFATVLSSYATRPAPVVVPSLVTPHGTYWGLVTAFSMVASALPLIFMAAAYFIYRRVAGRSVGGIG